MERSFQEYVHGENQRTYQEDFMVETKTVAELRQVDGELMRARERINSSGLKSRRRTPPSKKSRRCSA